MGQIIVGRPGGLASTATFQTLIGRTTSNVIRNNTSDGADNATILIGGGGAISQVQGAFLELQGNEVASVGGRFFIVGGSVATGNIGFQTSHASASILFNSANGAAAWSMDGNGDFLQNATTGRRIQFNRANQTINFAGTMATSSATVGTTAVANWIECQVAGNTRFIPSYAA